MNSGNILILHNQTFRLFWFARSISSLGDSMARIALVLLVYHINQSPHYVSLLLLAQVAPRFVGPITGVLSDKLEQKTLMIACDLMQLSLFTAMAFVRLPFAALLAMVVISGFVSTISAPASSSSIPHLVSEEALLSANLFLRSSQNVGMLIGPSIAGAVSAAFGARTTLLIDAFTFFLCALVMMRLPKLKPNESRQIHIFRDTREGLSYIVKTSLVRNLVFSLWIYVAFAAVSNLALVLLAQVSLHAGDRGYGFLTSAYGAGMLIGSVVLYRFQSRLQSPKALLLGLFLWGAGSLLTGLSPILGLAIVAQMIAAFGNTFENVGTDTVVQQIVPEHLLGRVYSTLFNGMEAAAGLAYLAGGAWLHLLSARETFLLSGGVVVIFVTFMIRMVRPTGHARLHVPSNVSE